MPQPTVVDIKKFFDFNSNRPVTMSEMQEFWKSLSESEKDNLRNSVSKWDGKTTFVN